MTPEYPIYLCLRLSRHRGSYSDIHEHDHPVHLSNRTYLRDSLLHEPTRHCSMAHGEPVFCQPNCELQTLSMTPLWEDFEVVLHHRSRSQTLESFVRECTLPSPPWTISHRLFGAIDPVVDDAASTNRVTRQCSFRRTSQK